MREEFFFSMKLDHKTFKLKLKNTNFARIYIWWFFSKFLAFFSNNIKYIFLVNIYPPLIIFFLSLQGRRWGRRGVVAILPERATLRTRWARQIHKSHCAWGESYLACRPRKPRPCLRPKRGRDTGHRNSSGEN